MMLKDGFIIMEQIINFYEWLYKKVGGKLNLILIMIVLLDILLIIVYKRLEFLQNVLENMCFYDYPKNYVCSCVPG